MSLPPSAVAHFAELRRSAAHPAVVDWLEKTVDRAPDHACVRINPFRVASDLSVDRLEATRAFLFATRLGITDLSWDIHCPQCSAVSEFHPRLLDLPQSSRCEGCQIGWDLSFEEQLEATFTLNANVRPMDVLAARSDPAPVPGDDHGPLTGAGLAPGTSVTRSATFRRGNYVYQLVGDPRMGRLVVDGAPIAAEQPVVMHVTEGGELDVHEIAVAPGRLHFTIHSRFPRADWAINLHPAGADGSWVSAAYITSLQDFRDLFAGEFLAPDRSFAIRSTTLLFTDITGSTEMYERLGDARAFALVQQHFDLMTAVIRRREGGIVKTIGDAVMAVFPVNLDAVTAALEIQEEFARVPDPLRQISVKIGLHRGPTIAVTSNRMLDYFGRTVNVAARVQSASESGEILVSEAVLADAHVAKLFAERGLSPARRSVSMKGIAGPVPVFSVRPKPS